METIISKLINGAIPRILPPVQRYFTYIFILIGIIWLGVANYYYFAEENNKSLAAVISGGIFLVMALITNIWERLLSKNEVTDNVLNELGAKFIPLLGVKTFEALKQMVQNKKTIRCAGFSLLIAAAYFVLIKKYKG
jgi:hypothetical protein